MQISDSKHLHSIDCRITVAVRRKAPDAFSVVSHSKENAVSVRDRDQTPSKPHRYRQPHLITGPQFQPFEWCKNHAQEIVERVFGGGQVLVLSYGQSKLAKRELLFGTGISSFGICPNLVGNLLKGVRNSFYCGKIECSFWSFSNGSFTDLLSSTFLPVSDINKLKAVPVESVRDVTALLKRFLPHERQGEDQTHLFARLRVDTGLRNLQGTVYFVDLADFPILEAELSEQGVLSDGMDKDTEKCKPRGISICQRELKEFCMIVSRLSKQSIGSPIPQVHCHSMFGQLLEKLLTQSVVYGLCCISEEPVHVFNTIASLRIAVRMQRIHSHSIAHSCRSEQSMTKSSPISHLKGTQSVSCCLEESPGNEHCPLRDFKGLAEIKDPSTLQDTNGTLLNLLDKQKRIQSYLQDQLEASKANKEELILKHQVEIKSAELQLQELKSKCRQLEKSSPLEMQFEIYEQETRKNLLQLQTLKDSNAELAAKLAEVETGAHSLEKNSNGPSGTPSKGQIFHSWSKKQMKKRVKSLEAQVTTLSTQNLNLRSKARCFEFYKEQCDLLMKEVAHLREKVKIFHSLH